jgi:hypothetical protein
VSTGPERSGTSGAAGTADPGARNSGWGQARRELAIAALLILALGAAAWTLDGAPAAGVVILVIVAASLAALRALIEPSEEPPGPESSRELGPSRTFLGFWRTRSDLLDATASLGAWDQRLRPRLVNLLAARLSERHGISLADDPDAARALLGGGPRPRHDLWPWIDPRRTASQDAASRPGIPANVLAALIDRLEKL